MMTTAIIKFTEIQVKEIIADYVNRTYDLHTPSDPIEVSLNIAPSYEDNRTFIAATLTDASVPVYLPLSSK